jgi:hypothetical protein
MKTEEQKLLHDSLSKLYKIEPETIASLYNEAGDLVDFSPILDLDAKRIQKLKSDSDSQYKRGIKEGASKIENAVKEKYEIESDLQGVELVDFLVVKKTEDVKNSKTDVTKHPDYIKLQVDIEKKLRERDKEWETKLSAREAETNEAKLFEKVSKRALANLKGRNPILPNDPRKAQVWEEVYLSELRKGKYMEGNDDSIIVLNAEGNPLTNTYGKPVTFDEYEKDVADKYFDYPKAEERSSPGNKDTIKTFTNVPKTQEEFQARLKDPNITPKERIELIKNFGEIK